MFFYPFKNLYIFDDILKLAVIFDKTKHER